MILVNKNRTGVQKCRISLWEGGSLSAQVEQFSPESPQKPAPAESLVAILNLFAEPLAFHFPRRHAFVNFELLAQCGVIYP